MTSIIDPELSIDFSVLYAYPLLHILTVTNFQSSLTILTPTTLPSYDLCHKRQAWMSALLSSQYIERIMEVFFVHFHIHCGIDYGHIDLKSI